MQFINAITGETITPQPWQMDLQPGDCYVTENPQIGLAGQAAFELDPSIVVYGEILNCMGCEPGFFNVRGFSVFCPEGEDGLFCIVEATRKISRDEFNAVIAAWRSV